MTQRGWRTRIAMAALVAACFLFYSGVAAQTRSDASQQTFNVRTNLVLVRVVVRNRDGRADGTFRKEDFQVFDKGKPQLISRFSLEGTAAPGTAHATGLPNPTTVSTGQPATQVHFIAYIFDDIHLSFGDLTLARQAAERHLAESLGATDRAAIYTSSGQTTVDFTSDLAKLREALGSIRPRPIAAPSTTDCPSLSYYEADLIRNRNDSGALEAATLDTLRCAHLTKEMANMARSMVEGAASRMVSAGEVEARLSLEVLDNAIARLSGLDGQASIVLVSPGFLLFRQRIDEGETMDRALRAGITISALDARGLHAMVPGGDASQPNGNPATMQARAKYQKDAELSQEDVMAELADATGGTFIHNSNDLLGGFRRIAEAPEYYYLLGFSPQNLKFDGSYHNLKVNLVKRGGGYTVQARRGYFAPKHKENADKSPKDKRPPRNAASDF